MFLSIMEIDCLMGYYHSLDVACMRCIQLNPWRVIFNFHHNPTYSHKYLDILTRFRAKNIQSIAIRWVSSNLSASQELEPVRFAASLRCIFLSFLLAATDLQFACPFSRWSDQLNAKTCAVQGVSQHVLNEFWKIICQLTCSRHAKVPYVHNSSIDVLIE